ncbi:MAG TPA: hypothetical protein VN795_05060 [Stellaceae bacterium]|jgi:hypothetical protein|nr:hypothetical protein [Stellaceae bacterium]
MSASRISQPVRRARRKLSLLLVVTAAAALQGAGVALDLLLVH